LAVDSQNRAYTNKSNLSTDKRFSQDRFKGGGRGNLKGRDKKSKNSEDGGKSNHTKTFETQNRRSGRAQYPSQPSSAPENTPSRAESLRKANPFGALDESSSEEDD